MPADDIEARLGVRAALDRYAEAVDRRRWDLLDELFDADLVWIWPDGRQTRGREAVIGELRGFLDHCGPVHNVFGSYSVALAGGSAVAKAHRRSYFAAADGSGRFMESLGEYRAELVFRETGWTITRFGETVLVRRGSRDVFSPRPQS